MAGRRNLATTGKALAVQSLLGFVIAVVALGGCASADLERPIASDDPASAALRLQSLGVTFEDLVDPTAVTPEMIEWIEDRLPESGGGHSRVRALVDAVIRDDGLGIEYNATYTGTAQEVYESRKANCLGFTNLIVGLGRALDLRLYYLGSRQGPTYERQGDLIVVWEHVTAGFGEADSRLVLRMAVGPRFELEDAAPLADHTALAMHYSNRGAELLREARLEEAERALEISVAVDPLWSHAWGNLGVVRRRLGAFDGAEAAYRTALDVDAEYFPAYQNLAALLWMQGRRDAARDLFGMLDRVNNRNPFIFMSLGDLFVRAAKPDQASRFYRRAARLAPESAEPLAALGLLAVERGQRGRARRLLQKAERRDATDARVEQLRGRLGETPSRGESSSELEATEPPPADGDQSFREPSTPIPTAPTCDRDWSALDKDDELSQ